MMSTQDFCFPAKDETGGLQQLSAFCVPPSMNNFSDYFWDCHMFTFLSFYREVESGADETHIHYAPDQGFEDPWAARWGPNCQRSGVTDGPQFSG